jgi:hypothetical protein
MAELVTVSLPEIFSCTSKFVQFRAIRKIVDNSKKLLAKFKRAARNVTCYDNREGMIGKLCCVECLILELTRIGVLVFVYVKHIDSEGNNNNKHK